MEIKDRTIALLIDSDNISGAYFSIILDQLSQYGKVTYRRLYGDFTNPQANGWKSVLLEYSIEQIQQIAFTSGKNATDSKMIIDAMDILYRNNVDCFCLATSDSDFTNLAMRFRNDNIVVIGAGEQKTPMAFRKACDIFILMDELLKVNRKEKSDSEEKKSNGGKAEAEKLEWRNKKGMIRKAKKIVADGADSGGWMHFPAFMNGIWREENDFNPMLYGAKNSRPIPFFKSLTEAGKPVFRIEKINQIDLIRIDDTENR